MIEQQQTTVQMAGISGRSPHVHSNTAFRSPSSRLPGALPSLAGRFSPSNSSANQVQKSDFSQHFDTIQPKGHIHPHCPPKKWTTQMDHTDGPHRWRQLLPYRSVYVQSAATASSPIPIKAAPPIQITVCCSYELLTRKSPSCAGVGICKGSGSSDFCLGEWQWFVREGDSDCMGAAHLIAPEFALQERNLSIQELQ